MRIKRLCFLSLITLGIIFLESCDSIKPKEKVSVDLFINDTLFETAKVTVDDEYELPIGTKIGMDFEGWFNSGKAYTDSEGSSLGKKWLRDYPTKLYAEFEPKSYTIRLDAGDGRFLDDPVNYKVKYKENISGIVLPVPILEGYEFSGYFVKKSVNGVYKDYQITNNRAELLKGKEIFDENNYNIDLSEIKLFAKYNLKTTKIEVKGTNLEYSLPVGEVILNIPYEVKDNYAFTGYYFDELFQSKVEFPYTVQEESETIYFYPKYVKGTEIGLSYTSIPGTNDTKLSASYIGNAEKVVVPDSYYGKEVVEVSRIDAPNAKSIYLADSIINLNESALMNNINVELIHLPKNLDSIPRELLMGNTALKEVNIPSEVYIIKAHAFKDCSSLEYLNLNEKLQRIEGGAFDGLLKLKAFNVSEKNNYIYTDNGVLYRKSGKSLYLIQYPINKAGFEYTVDENTYKIEDGAFRYSNLRKLTINSRLTEIGDFAFANCNELYSISIGTSLEYANLGKGIFANSWNLNTVILNSKEMFRADVETLVNSSAEIKFFIPSDLKVKYVTSSIWRERKNDMHSIGSIFGDWAIVDIDLDSDGINDGVSILAYFGTKENLEIPSVLNGKAVVDIASRAFIYNKNLKKLTINSNVKRIGNLAFSNNSSLESVYINSSSVIQIEGNPFEIGAYFYLVKDAVGLLDDYRLAWKQYSEYIWTGNE